MEDCYYLAQVVWCLPSIESALESVLYMMLLIFTASYLSHDVGLQLCFNTDICRSYDSDFIVFNK